jgi:hypothetical protein
MPDPSQFNTDRTYPGLWTITFSNPPINMSGPATIVELGALMTDLEADPSVKVVVFQSAAVQQERDGCFWHTQAAGVLFTDGVAHSGLTQGRGDPTPSI